ncbi:MAG: hypothetical protein GY811_07110 [Myxococcales bacterium]|nr:hypothetical protein [Myxococcales bacterium]
MSLPNRIEYSGHLLGGQPSESQYKQLSVEGYKTVISIRAPEEPGATDSKNHAESAGMKFVCIPVAGAGDFTKEKARAFDEALQGEGPFVVHCKSGGRVAALYTLKLGWVDGKSVDEAMAEGEKIGLGGMEAAIRKLLR